jgi:hypothetical protein
VELMMASISMAGWTSGDGQREWLAGHLISPHPAQNMLIQQ